MPGFFNEVFLQAAKQGGKSLLDPRVSPQGIPVRGIRDVGRGSGTKIPDNVLPPPPGVGGPPPPRVPLRGGLLAAGAAGAGAGGAGIYGISRLDNNGEPVPLLSGEDVQRQKQQIAETRGQTLEEIEVDAKKKVLAELPKKDQDWLDKFSEGFDLATFGLHLLANNDGEQNMASKIGQALSAARQYTDDKETVAKRDKLVEREISAMEKRADADMISAIGSVNKALGLKREKGSAPNSTALTEAQVMAQSQLGDSYTLSARGDKAREGDAELVLGLANVYQTLREENKALNRPPPTQAELQEAAATYIKRITEQYGTFREGTIFGIGRNEPPIGVSQLPTGPSELELLLEQQAALQAQLQN